MKNRLKILTFLMLLTNGVLPETVHAQYVSPYNSSGNIKSVETRRYESNNQPKTEPVRYERQSQPKSAYKEEKKYSAPAYERTTEVSDNAAPVWTYGNPSIIDEKYLYSKINYDKDTNGMMAVATGNKYGFVWSLRRNPDSAIKAAIPVIYDDTKAPLYKSLLYGVRLHGKWGFVGTNNTVIIPFIYDNVLRGFLDGITVVEKDGKKFDINEKGEILKEYPSLPPNKKVKLVTSTNGIIYETVKIGKQVWATKNLSVTTFRNGETIREAKNAAEWNRFSESKKAAWCYYQFDVANEPIYGRLYNFYAVNDPRGLAPEGFHIPSFDEYQKTASHLTRKVAGIKMKSSIGWKSALYYIGTNESGFTGLPGGAIMPDGTVESHGYQGFWWSATASVTHNGLAECFSLNDKTPYLHRTTVENGWGCSVRCISDL